MAHLHDFQEVLRTQILHNETVLECLQSDRDSYLSHDATLAQISYSFLILLSGSENPFYKKTIKIWEKWQQTDTYADIISFYNVGLKLISQELNRSIEQHPGFAEQLKQAASSVGGETNESVFDILFPLGTDARKPESYQQEIETIRKTRIVKNIRVNPHPIKKPVQEILFTSNVLLTIPTIDHSVSLDLPDSIKKHLAAINAEDQKYWYDHPTPVGVSADQNEILYGLRGLDSKKNPYPKNSYKSYYQCLPHTKSYSPWLKNILISCLKRAIKHHT